MPLTDYISMESNFYEPITCNISKEGMYDKIECPNGWTKSITKDGIWINYINPDNIMQDQGWKIHISSRLEDAENVIKLVSEYLFIKGVNFKHLSSRFVFKSNVSKNAKRDSAGKFITIYPADKDFVTVIQDLESILKDAMPGPYILSDRRYKKTNIFYRYGGFIKREVNGKFVINDLNGQPIEDKRVPYYVQPDFVKDPFEKEGKFWEEDKNDQISNLNKYDIIKALKFNAGGGIYLAKIKENNQLVVIKEARPYVGYDGWGLDSIYRLNNEYDNLVKLLGVPEIIKPVDKFQEWEHWYIVEEYAKGENLNNWLAGNYPIMDHQPRKIYLKKVEKIYTKLKDCIKKMHDIGMGFGDLQNANIIIDDKENIRLVDLESAGEVDEPYHGLMTLGFANKNTLTRKERDLYALDRILIRMLMPLSPVYEYDFKIDQIYKKEILSRFRDIKNKSFYADLKDIWEKSDNVDSRYMNNMNEIKTLLVNGILSKNDLINDMVAPGEFTMFTEELGKYNYLNGGFGILFALKGYVDFSEYFKWMKSSVYHTLKSNDNSLFYGKAGIASILYEMGYNDLGKLIVDKIIETDISSINDLSLDRGLAGIGIAMINIYSITNSVEVLHFINMVYMRIEKITRHLSKEKFQRDLISGSAGVGLFLILYSKINKSKDVYWRAFDMLSLSEDALEFSMFRKIFELKKGNIFSPYLKGGSIGVLLTLRLFDEVYRGIWFRLITATIKKFDDYNIMADAGLMTGIGSKLLIYADFKEINEKKIIDLLNRYIVSDGYKAFIPGKLAMRLSCDVESGNAGLLLALDSITNNNKFGWLPININRILEI